jgi:hypothetical protein
MLIRCKHTVVPLSLSEVAVSRVHTVMRASGPKPYDATAAAVHMLDAAGDDDGWDYEYDDGATEEEEEEAAEAALLAARRRAAAAEDRATRHHEQTEFHQYLHSFGAQYAHHRQALLAKHQAEEQETVTAHPVITPFAAGKKRDEKIEERLFRLQEKRMEKRKEAKKEAEEDAQQRLLQETGGYIGKPRISAAAKQLRRDGTIAESSARWMEEHKKRLATLHEDALKRELAELRPAPRIAASSAAAAVDRGGLTVEEHLTMLEKQRQRKLYEQVEQRERDARKQAHPQLAAYYTRAARSASASAHNTTAEEKAQAAAERLYNPHYKLPAYDPEFIERCTFQPRTYSTVNPNDDLMQLPVHERLAKRRERAREAMLKSVVAEQRQKAASEGRPQLSKQSRRLAAERSVSAADGGSGGGAVPTADNSPSHHSHPRSTATTATSRFGGSPTDRLYGDALKRREDHKHKVAVVRAASASRGPTLSKKSRELNMMNPDISQATNAFGRPGEGQAVARTFDDRLQLYTRKANEKKRKMEAEEKARDAELMETECTFAPQLDRVREETRAKGKAKASMADEPHMRRQPTIAEKDFFKRNQRWMEARDKHLEMAKVAKEEKELAECVFEPAVISETPIPTLSSQVAAGGEDHIRRMQVARAEQALKEAGGLNAIRWREAVASAHRTDTRTTEPQEFSLRLGGGRPSPRAGAHDRSFGTASPSASIRGAATPRGGAATGRSTRDGAITALRPPVTASDVDGRFVAMADDDYAGGYGAQHFYGRRSTSAQPSAGEYHLPHQASSHVGSAWASHGVGAPPAFDDGRGVRSGTGFFRDDAWGEPVHSGQTSAGHTYEQPGVSYAPNGHRGWGGGGSNATTAAVDAVIRNHHSMLRDMMQHGSRGGSHEA